MRRLFGGGGEEKRGTSGSRRGTVTQKGAAASSGNQVECSWMWADAGRILGHGAAQRDPVRWSAWQDPQGTIQDLSRTKNPDTCSRPVEMRIGRDAQNVLKFENIDRAVQYLAGKTAGQAGGASASRAVGTTGQFQAGGDAEVFSVSAGLWIRGTVTEVQDNVITVVYTAPNGSQVLKKLPATHEHLRSAGQRQASAPEKNQDAPQTHERAPARKGAQTMPARPRVENRASVAPAMTATSSRKKSIFQHALHPQQTKDCGGLQGVPGIGVKSLGKLQADTTRRAQRLIAHGDIRGAKRTLVRAKKLKVPPEEIEELEPQLLTLQVEGEFCLLLQSSDNEDENDAANAAQQASIPKAGGSTLAPYAF